MVNRFRPKTFHIDGTGHAKVLGELEAKIMDVVWMKGKVTVREVCEEFSAHNHESCFNTVMTVMNRLVDKKILKKNKKGLNRYSPIISKKKFSAIVASDIIGSVLKDPLLFSAANFADVAEDLDEETVRVLKQFIKESKA